MTNMGLNSWNEKELKRWIETLKTEPVRCEELTEEQIWSDEQTQIWQARRFCGSPSFYPVYRWRDYYSYSPLMLLLKKGSFDLDMKVSRLIAAEGRNYLSSAGTLDSEIKRLGGPLIPKFRIRTPEQYASAIVQALRKDIARVEADHPNSTNVILCGGKDSLNLLFLPWKNPVIVASAAPNYVLVKQFIADHALPYDIIELKDDDRSLLPQEILVNFCRNNLEHCRWAPSLVQIAQNLGGKLIFWKGQIGDRRMTPHWDDYTDPPENDWVGLKRVCSVWGGRGEYWARRNLKKWGITQRRTFRAFWDRGAMWQGAHMSIQRQLTGALTLSTYHGKEMRRVVEQVDFNRAVPYDIRPLIGELLYGGPVRYPANNPSPPPSTIRRGFSHLQPFLDVLKFVGIPVNDRKKHILLGPDS